MSGTAKIPPKPCSRMPQFMLVAEWSMVIFQSMACCVISVEPQTIALEKVSVGAQRSSRDAQYPSARSELDMSETRSRVLRVKLQFCGFRGSMTPSLES